MFPPASSPLICQFCHYPFTCFKLIHPFSSLPWLPILLYYSTFSSFFICYTSIPPSSCLPLSHPLNFSHNLPLLVIFQSPNWLAPHYPCGSPFTTSPYALLVLFHHLTISSPPPSSTGALPPVSLRVLQLPFRPWQPSPFPQPAVREWRERAGRPARHTQLWMHQLPRWGIMNVAGWICMCLSHVNVRTEHWNICKNVCTWHIGSRLPADTEEWHGRARQVREYD